MPTSLPRPARRPHPVPWRSGTARPGRPRPGVGRYPISLALLLLANLGAGCADGSTATGERRRAGAEPDGNAGAVVTGPAPVSARACREAAYLCPGLAERGQVRVMRWEDGTGEIRVRIPRPPNQPASVARSLQDAAVAGIRTWQDRPFPLRVLRSDADDPADIVVRWVSSMEGAELGRAATEWSRSADGEMAMRVRDFILALENPYRPGTLLDPASVRLTAAHEMGHALGLPHSDSPRDVMYPTNTANSLSARDYRAMNGLYALENGALLPVDPGGPGS